MQCFLCKKQKEESPTIQVGVISQPGKIMYGTACEDCSTSEINIKNTALVFKKIDDKTPPKKTA